jgi:Spy/CpxP family protein refolding chaperone
MNKLSFASLLTCAALTLAPFALNAADDGAPPPPRRERGPGGPGGFGGPGGRGGQFAAQPKLTPEERTKLNAGLKKIAKDEDVAKAQAEVREAQKKVIEAQKKANEARKAALLKADPELAEIVKKFGDAPIRPTGPRGDGAARPEGRRGEGRRGGNRAAPQKAPSADNV